MPADSMPLQCYARALRLYPREFRLRFAEQALLTARQWQRETPHPLLFSIRLAADFFVSLIQQHTASFWRYPMKRSVLIYSTVLFVLLAALLTTSAVVDHTLLRQTANQPQQQMAERYAQRLGAGVPADTVLPGGHVDIAQDLDPFVILYNNAGQPIAGNGYLDGAMPTPPAGVFTETRTAGFDRLSWQPRHGVRIAMVAQRVDGPNPGFVVAGRSLSDTERKESRVYSYALHGLLLLFLMIGGAGVMLTRASNRPTPA